MSRIHRASSVLRRSSPIAVALCAGAITSFVSADTTLWTGPSGSTFSNASNWSAGIPDTDDEARFNVDSFMFVSFTSSPLLDRLRIERGSVIFKMSNQTMALLGSDRAAPALTLGAADSDANAGLTIQNGTLVAPRVVIADAVGASASLQITTLDAATSALVADSIVVGSAGTGSLSCTFGGTAETTSLDVAVAPNESGVLAVGGQSPWDVDASITVHDVLMLGVGGDAKCFVGNHGSVVVEGDCRAAVLSGSSAWIAIAGSSSGAATFAVLGSCKLGVAGPTLVSVTSDGHIEIGGSLVASSDVDFEFQLSATTIPSRSSLSVAGTASMQVADEDNQTGFAVTLDDDFEPPIGVTYAIATVAEPTEWPNLSVPATTLRRRYEAIVSPTSVSVEVRAGTADITGDNAIDMRDLGALLGAWSADGPADLSGDGVVDAVDLAIFLSAF